MITDKLIGLAARTFRSSTKAVHARSIAQKLRATLKERDPFTVYTTAKALYNKVKRLKYKVRRGWILPPIGGSQNIGHWRELYLLDSHAGADLACTAEAAEVLSCLTEDSSPGRLSQ